MGRLSVVIPAYRAERFLPQTLDSVLAQTISDLDCVVVDDGSDDGTADVVADYVRRDPRVRAIHQDNAGVSAARNRGFAALHSSGGYVAFLDADDIWEQDALALLAQALCDDPSASGAHGVVGMIDAAGTPLEPGNAERRTRDRPMLVAGRVKRCPAGAPTTFASLILRDVLLTPGNLVMRRELFERIGGFDPRLHGNADWDFALRLAAVGHIAFVNRTVLRYRKHVTAMSLETSAIEAFARERVTIMKKLNESPHITAEQRRLVHLADRRVDAVESWVAASDARASLQERRFRQAARYARQAVIARLKGVARPILSRRNLMNTRRVL